MPSTHVPLSPALTGAAVAAILWQLLSIIFTAFIVNSVSYAAIYSGFAILVVFLVWLYAAWLIVLIGAEIAYLHQHSSVYLPGAAGKARTPVRRTISFISAVRDRPAFHYRQASGNRKKFKPNARSAA